MLKTQKLIDDLKIKKMFVAHSVSLFPKDIVFDAKQKAKAYVDRRNRKDKQLEQITGTLAKQEGAFTIESVYKVQMELKVQNNPKKGDKIVPKLDNYFIKMLERQVQKLVYEGKLKASVQEDITYYSKSEGGPAKL